jgi:hypothetical protein
MRAWLCFPLFIIACSACVGQGVKTSAPASAAVNLTGTWTLDFNSSDFGGPKTDLIYDSLTLIISHNDPVLKITRRIGKKKTTRTQELIYYTDGRGEKNPSANEKGQIESKTSWQGKVVITNGTQSTPGFGDVIMSDATDKWELSDDGNTLIEYTASSPLRSKFGKSNFGSIGALKAKKVFRKQP